MPSGLPQSLNAFASWLSGSTIAWWAVGFYFLYGVLSSVQLLLWVLTGVSVLCFLRYGSAWLRAPGAKDYGILVACWVIPGALSCLDAVNSHTALSTLGRLAAYGAMGLCLLRLQITHRQWPGTVLVLAGLLAAWSFDGLIQAMLGTSLSGYPLSGVLPEGPKVTGSMGLDYGITLAILSPVLFEAVRLHGSQRVSVWVALVLTTVAVALSASRYAAVLYLFSALISFSLARSFGSVTSLRAAGLAGVICLLGIALTTLLSPTLSARLHLLLAGLSFDVFDLNFGLAFRPELWHAGWAIFAENWINGVGLRGSPLALQSLLQASVVFPDTLKDQLWHPHLGVLEVMVDTGIFGLMGYLAFLGVCARLIRRGIAQHRPQTVIFATVGLLALFPLSTTTSMFSFSAGSLAWPSLAFACSALWRGAVCDSDEGADSP